MLHVSVNPLLKANHSESIAESIKAQWKHSKAEISIANPREAGQSTLKHMANHGQLWQMQSIPMGKLQNDFYKGLLWQRASKTEGW